MSVQNFHSRKDPKDCKIKNKKTMALSIVNIIDANPIVDYVYSKLNTGTKQMQSNVKSTQKANQQKSKLYIQTCVVSHHLLGCRVLLILRDLLLVK